MKRPDAAAKRRLSGAALLSILALGAHSAYAELPEQLAENWYRTELLVFVKEDAASLGGEQWAPLPELAYPDNTRFLIDPAVADRRLAESLAYASSIDTFGVQSLLVPAPIDELLDHSRPDAITEPVVDPLLPELLSDATADAAPSAIGNGSADAETPDVPAGKDQTDPTDPDPDADIDLESPVVALAYELLDDDELAFRGQARRLRRQGHRIMFHGSWWATLDNAEQTPALVLDHSGDIDSRDWPALQGSVHIYRTRYLHIALDLWLNTLGEYLPQGWHIDSPPRSSPSLKAATLAGLNIDPWAPAVVAGSTGEDSEESTIRVASPDDGPIAVFDAAADAAPGELPAAAETFSYPWHHAITHRQSRRMRSGEIHYLDHPVIGVVVRITPMDEETLPLLPPEERAFRERHGLPVELLAPEQNPENLSP